MSDLKEKRKVLFLSYAAYPLFDPTANEAHGGAEVDIFNIATHINRNLFDVHFIVGDYGQKKYQIIDDIHIYSAQKIKNSSALMGIVNFLSLYYLIKKINPDIIFTKAFGWLTVELILIKMFLRKKLVFRSSHRKNLDGTVDSRPYGKVLRMLINKIDYFFIQNEEDRAIFLRTYPFKNPLTHIVNLHPIQRIVPQEYSERTCILWIGRSEAVKNPGAFLELAKRLPNESFQMILTKTNESIYTETILKSKDIQNIKILEKMPHSKILEVFSKAKYLVTTSFSEGFPNILIEALSKGTPIISLHIDFDNLVKENNIGFLGDGSVESLKHFIEKTNEPAWNALSQNAYALAKNHFNISSKIMEYEKIFLGL